MYACMYVRTYVCTYVRMYVCMYVRTYVCMYVCMYNYYELNHVMKTYLDGGATEADNRVNAPMGPSVATPLCVYMYVCACS